MRTVFQAYVIQRVEDGAFVAPRGQAKSYVKGLQDARVFQSFEAAERERCIENERLLSVLEAFTHPHGEGN